MNKITEYRTFLFYYEKLKKISRALSKLDVLACNVGLNEKQEKRLAKLEKEADEYASALNLKAYHQGDPRGVSLYLIDDTMNNTNYTNGIVIY